MADDPSLKDKLAADKHRAFSSEPLPLRELLIAEMNQMLDEKLDKRIQRSLRTMQVLVVVVVGILAPSSIFTVKQLINSAIDSMRNQLTVQIDTADKNVSRQFQLVSTQLNNEVLLMATSSQIASILVQGNVSEDQMKNIRVNLKKIAARENTLNSLDIDALVNNVVRLFVTLGYDDYLQEVATLFPESLQRSSTINAQFLAYYSRKILNDANRAAIQSSAAYPHFRQCVDTAQLHKADEDSIAYQALVAFHIAGATRNPISTEFLRSTENLMIKNKADFLWLLVSNTSPRYWTRSPSSSDYRIAKVAENFLKTYYPELQAIANVNGVKETLRDREEKASTSEDLRIGKAIFDYFYERQNKKSNRVEEHAQSLPGTTRKTQ